MVIVFVGGVTVLLVSEKLAAVATAVGDVFAVTV
jgi:hypothetical protein